jgi:AcrR family transcriptional regulator
MSNPPLKLIAQPLLNGRSLASVKLPWRVNGREWADMKKKAHARIRTRNIEDKKRRIIDAAQMLFTGRGYSQTSIKDVAKFAGVSPALVMLHFKTKKDLFRETLIYVLTHTRLSGPEKTNFATRLAQQMASGGGGVLSPSMIALSLGDEEARRVAATVARNHILSPTTEWLGEPYGYERAAYLMILSLGLALFMRLFAEDQLEADSAPTCWVAAAIQSAVDGEPSHSSSSKHPPRLRARIRRS